MLREPIDKMWRVSSVTTSLTPSEEEIERLRATLRRWRLLDEVAALHHWGDAAHVDQADGATRERFPAGRTSLAALGRQVLVLLYLLSFLRKKTSTFQLKKKLEDLAFKQCLETDTSFFQLQLNKDMYLVCLYHVHLWTLQGFPVRLWQSDEIDGTFLNHVQSCSVLLCQKKSSNFV